MNILEEAAEHMERNGWRPDGFDMDDGSLCLINTIHKVFANHFDIFNIGEEQRILWNEIRDTCFTCSHENETASSFGIALHNDQHIKDKFEAIDLLKRAAKRIDI